MAALGSYYTGCDTQLQTPQNVIHVIFLANLLKAVTLISSSDYKSQHAYAVILIILINTLQCFQLSYTQVLFNRWASGTVFSSDGKKNALVVLWKTLVFWLFVRKQNQKVFLFLHLAVAALIFLAFCTSVHKCSSRLKQMWKSVLVWIFFSFKYG